MLFRSTLLPALLSTLLLLSACIGTQQRLNTDVATQQLNLRNLDSFKITGGLGVWTDQESISTRIEWLQLKDDFDLRIRLPAGLRTVQVTRKNGLASVRNGSTQPEIGRSAGVLLQQALGLSVAVPIEQMAVWIRGLPGDGAQSVTYDDQQRLKSMVYVDEQGTRWTAKVLKYSTHAGAYVPSTILTTGGPYTVRLTLKNWSEPGVTQISSVELDQLTQPSTGPVTRLKVPGR